MAESNKRPAQSPLSGDEDDLKRRIIMVDPPVLVSLEETSEEEDETSGDTALEELLKNGAGKEPDTSHSAAERVDSLINRMDKFMECFANLHSTVTKNQNSNSRKFKRLELAHNDLATKVTSSANSMVDRLDSLETKLKETQSENTKLADKIRRIEEEQISREGRQKQVNDNNAKRLISLEEEQGFVNRNLLDCRSEVKEKKLILSGVAESPNEDVSKVALDSINKVIEAAIAVKAPDAQLGNLRKLHRGSIDNVYRIGKVARGPYNRNISVTFLKYDDKDMVIKAKSDLKGDADVKIFFNEDVSTDGRVLKARLRRIVQVAKEQGKSAKMSGNKVTINSRTYHSNELSLLPEDVADGLKHEKLIEDGIIFKGENSIFSNFYPAAFVFDENVFQHVEQYYQHCKAEHHNETLTADRIMRMSNPRRIKALGDSIESNPDWLERRMMVLYRGIKSKFEQNWHLQDELIASHGKQLYEATTDRYFGCGISFESTRWEQRDWPGENVAGLILMKVREELLGMQHEQSPASNTLIDIASEGGLDTSTIMDTHDGSTTVPLPDNECNETPSVATQAMNPHQSLGDSNRPSNKTMSRVSVQSGSSVRERELSYHTSSNMVNSTVSPPHRGPTITYGDQSSVQYRGTNRKGRGRGRGRNFRGFNNQQRYASGKTRKQQTKMTDSDRDFLLGSSSNNRYDSVNTSSTPKNQNKNCSNPLGLSDHQLKGLALLGLSLPASTTH